MAQEEGTTTENNQIALNNEANQSTEQVENNQGTEQNNTSNVDDSNDYFKTIDINDDDFEVEELNEEVAFNYLKKSKGLEVESFDDLLKPREVNPYEDVLDDEDKAYLNFKKETGRSRKEFEALNSNLDELPKIELARERVRKETGLTLTNEQVDEYIAEELGIDLEDMRASDQIKLASYTKSILEEKKAEQQKYRTPIESKQQPEAKKENTQQEEYVKLENGAVMLKSQYDNLVNTRQQAILQAKEAVNSVTNSDFKITIDDKGTPKEMNFAYEYSEEDKQSMVSIVSDIDGVVASRYSSEKGFDHKRFAEDMQWSDPKFREKAIASLLHKAIASNTEQVLKERGNINFANEPLQKQAREGVKVVSMADAIKGNI
jgi:hypothetical protein